MNINKQISNWKALKKGDRSAFEQLYRDHVKVLYRYGLKFSRSSEIVEDAVQDLFIELWRNRNNLSETDSVRKYLFVAMRRKVLQIIERKEKKYTSGETEPFFLSLKDESGNSPDRTFDGGPEAMARVKTTIRDLSPRQREAIYLKYFAGMDNEEIGQIMDLNDQSVRNLLSRALNSLRKSLTILLWSLICFC